MSTSLDKLNEIILGKILTDAEINNLVKELRPVVVKELKEQMLKTIKDYDWTDAVHETINDMYYDIARSFLKKIDFNITLKPTKKEKK